MSGGYKRRRTLKYVGKTYPRGIYKSYQFQDHDPILDQIATVIVDSELTYSEISARSGVSMTTLNNWRQRYTKRPQFASVAAVVRACGAKIIVTYQGKIIK